MHELSICSAIAAIAARRADGRPIERVTVEIGQLRQVVPSTLVFCWELVTDGTTLAGSALEVVHVPAVIRCRRCGQTHALDEPVFACPACSSTDVEVIGHHEHQGIGQIVLFTAPMGDDSISGVEYVAYALFEAGVWTLAQLEQRETCRRGSSDGYCI